MFTYETYSHPSIYVEPLLCKTFGGPCRPRSVDFGRLQIRHCTPGGCCRCRWHHQIGEDVGAQATCFQQKPATKIISRCLKQNPPKEQNSLHHSETFRKRLRGVGNLSKRKGYFCHIWRNIVTLCIYIYMQCTKKNARSTLGHIGSFGVCGTSGLSGQCRPICISRSWTPTSISRILLVAFRTLGMCLMLWMIL